VTTSQNALVIVKIRRVLDEWIYSNMRTIVLIVVVTTLVVPTITYNANAAKFEIDKSQFKKAPEFRGTTGYMNTLAPLKLADLRGKVILVHFWTSTCSTCIHTVPHLNEWYQKYSNKGLVIVGFFNLILRKILTM
jgi:thiol-disulfide isomerase/thioredoxin